MHVRPPALRRGRRHPLPAVVLPVHRAVAPRSTSASRTRLRGDRRRGMVDPNVFAACGYDPEEFTGSPSAWASSASHAALRRARHPRFTENDARFLRKHDLTRIKPGDDESTAELAQGSSRTRTRASLQRTAELFTFSGTEVEGIEAVGEDKVLHCAVTSNRVDCLGMIGLARDLAAVARHRLVPAGRGRREAPRRRRRAPATSRSGCPTSARDTRRSSSRALTVGPSPEWLRNRLEAIGVGDQQRRRRDEFRPARVRAAAARVRPRLGSRRAIVVRRRRRRDVLGAQRQGVRARSHDGVIADAERPGRPRRRHGR